MPTAAAGRRPASPVATDGDVIIVALGLVAGMAAGPVAGTAVALGAGVACRRRVVVVAVAAVAVVVGALAWNRAWAAAHIVTLGQVTGVVTVVGDPAPIGRGVRLTVKIDDQRFDAWVYGRRAARVAELQVGERVWIDGVRRPLGRAAARARLRHVVGVVQVAAWGDVRAGPPVFVSAARLRRTVRRVAETSMGSLDGALFSGLVLGDDAREPPTMVAQFRASGLSHLTAVSGQNITLLMALLGPLLRRLRPAPRLLATLAAVAWLVLVTRFEPSVLRAGMMAALAAVAFASGRPTPPLRLLALSLSLILLVDPLLVRSVGLWLSAGATAGVLLVSPLLYPALAGPRWLRHPLSLTLGAQLGVAIPSLIVFGRLPVVALATNVAAVPVAAVVMTIGVPCAMAAALWPPAAALWMFVPTIGTRWVRRVAEVGAAAEPSPVIGMTLWAVVVAAVIISGVRRRAAGDPDVAA